MANVTISELPEITLPAVAADTYFETYTLESGVPVSRKISLADLPSATGIQTVNSGTNITVDNTDPQNPIINLNNPVVANLTGNVTGNVTGNLTGDVTGNLTGNVVGNLTGDVTGDVNGVTLTAGGGGTLFLADDGVYKAAGGGTVDSVVGGSNIQVDSTDPANPVVHLVDPVVADLTGNVTGAVNGVMLDSSGIGTLFLADDGTYLPAGGGTFPSGSVGDMLYLDTAPDIYTATSNLTFEPATPVHTFRGGAPRFEVQRFQNNASGSVIALDKSRDPATGGHVIVQSGDTLGSVIFEGSDGSNFIPGASIIGAVDGTPGVSDMPGRLVFSTTLDGASGVSERLRIRETGQIVQTVPSAAFAVPITLDSFISNMTVMGPGDIFLTLQRYSADANGATLGLLKSRNATNGSATIVQNDDVLGRIDFYGVNAAASSRAAARIQAQVDGSPGAGNDMPGRLVFLTTPDGTAVPTEAIRLTQAGQLVSTEKGNTYGTPLTFSTLVPQIYVAVGAGSGTGLASVRYSADAAAAFIYLGKSRSNGFGSAAVVSSGDSLGTIDFRGTDGSAMISAATITGASDGTPGANDMPGRLVFNTTLDGASSATERMRIRNQGQVVVTANGATYANPPQLSALDAKLVLQGTDNVWAAWDAYKADTTGAGFLFRKSRNATVGSQTIVGSGDTLGFINFYGSNGTSFDLAAQIIAEVDGTPGASNDMPGRIRFGTTPDGSASTLERMRIIEQGAIVMTPSGAGYGTPIASSIGGVAGLTVQQGGGGSGPIASIDAYNTGATGVGELALRHSRSATVGANTIVVSGDRLGDVSWYGADGSAMVVAAMLRGEVDGTPGANDMPGRLLFYTTADGAATGTERMRINSAGRLVLGAGGTGAQIVSGSGTPEGAITAPPGSIYLNTAGGAATSLYVKESGAGNTGWVGK